MKNLFLAMLLLGIFSACKKTPFGIEPKDCEGVSTAKNLEKLEVLKKTHSGKTQFKVAILADSHNAPQALADAIDRMQSRGDIDLMFILGDISDEGLEMEYDWTCKALQRVKVPLFTVIGNHDSLANGKEIYRKYFGDYNYSFTYLGTKFVFYNDNGFEFPEAPDLAFLRNESVLAPGESRNHTIAASHVPPAVDVHSQAEIDQFLSSMNEYGYQYTIHGHLHAFDYFKDKFENKHYVVSSARKNDSGIMTVTPTSVVFENCSKANCSVTEAK